MREGVGGELMKRHSEVLCCRRRQGNDRTAHVQPLRRIEVRFKLPSDEISQRHPLPIVGDDEVMGAPKSLNPFAQALRIVADCRAGWQQSDGRWPAPARAGSWNGGRAPG